MPFRDVKTAQKVQENSSGVFFQIRAYQFLQTKISPRKQNFWWNTGFYLWCWALWSTMLGAGQAGSHLHSLPLFPSLSTQSSICVKFTHCQKCAGSVRATVPLSQLLHKNYLSSKCNISRVFTKANWWGHYLNFLLESTGWHMLAFKPIPWTHFLQREKGRWNPLRRTH